MSRETRTIVRDGKELSAVFGFDRPVGLYFFGVFNSAQDEVPVTPLQDYIVGVSQDHLVELMTEWGLPQADIDFIASDEPHPYDVEAEQLAREFRDSGLGERIGQLFAGNPNVVVINTENIDFSQLSDTSNPYLPSQPHDTSRSSGRTIISTDDHQSE